jgi:hypothetical protein
MTTKHYLCFAAFTLIGLSVQASQQGPLSFTLPPGWSVKYSAKKYPSEDNSIPYVFPAPTSKKMVFNIAKWLGPEKPSDIPDLVKMTVHDVQYTIQDFKGMPFSGTVVRFPLKTGIGTSFMFSQGNTLWKGMFNGSEQEWNSVLDVLKTLKIQDKQDAAAKL